MDVTPVQQDFGFEVRPDEGADADVFALDITAVTELYKQSGVLVFKGFGLSADDFDRFADLFTDEYMTYRGGGYVRKSVEGARDPALLSVNYDHGRDQQDTWGLPLHGEMYYLKNRPKALWFFCQQPASEGGETTICDGSKVFAALSEDTRQYFTRQRLKFSRKYVDGEWQKIYQTDDIEEARRFCEYNGLKVHVDKHAGVISTTFLQPAVVDSAWGNRRVFINSALPVLWQERMGRGETSIVRFEDDSPIRDDKIDELVEVQQRYIVPVALARGEVAFLDNTRTLHGRREFSDTRREIYLRMVREYKRDAPIGQSTDARDAVRGSRQSQPRDRLVPSATTANDRN